MTIWVDADSVPVAMRAVILRAAVRTGCPACFVADRILKDVASFIAEDTHSIRVKTGSKTDRSAIKLVTVQSGTDSADNYVVQNASPGDLCITHDIPLASRLLEKGCAVIDDRGGQFTLENISSRLFDRDINSQLRLCGVFEKQSKTTGSSNIKAFSDNFDRVLTSSLLTKTPQNSDNMPRNYKIACSDRQ